MSITDDLVLVVIDCPYDTIASKITQDLLIKTMALKISGYRQDYEYGVLPVDTSDLIAAHQLVCKKTKEGLIPLTGYKSTTLQRSKIHGLTFPGLGLVRSANAPLHERAVEKIMADCEGRGASLAYTSSWTMDKTIPKSNRELRTVLRELFETMYVRYHLEYGIDEILVGGTLRFKTEVLFNFWGHHPLKLEDHELSHINVPNLLGEPVVVMHLKNFSNEAIEKVEKWRSMWDQRVTIAGDTKELDELFALRKAS